MRVVGGLRISPSMVVMVISIVVGVLGVVGVGSSMSSSKGEIQTKVRALLLVVVEVVGVAGTLRSPKRHCRGWSERVDTGSATPTTVPPPLTTPVTLGVAKGSNGR